MGIDVFDRRGLWPSRSVEEPGVAWHGRRDLDAWKDTLTAYTQGGIERGEQDHEAAIKAAGWRRVGGEWTPPARQRRSVEQVGVALRVLVDGLDPRVMPACVPRGVVRAMIGLVEALGCILFYPTLTEAMNGRFGVPRRRHDPTRAAFGSTASVLREVSSPVGERSLGAGPQSYAIAESRGRTRARWDEVHCAASHISGGGVKGLHAIERAIDAQRSVIGAALDPVDEAGLCDWLEEGARPEERVRRYRARLALSRGAGAGGIVSTTGALAATSDFTDRAILERLTRAREALEAHFGRAPEKGEALAMATGDVAFLAPIVARRERRERLPKQRASRSAQKPQMRPSWS